MDTETAALIELVRSTRRPQMRETAVRQLAERMDPEAAPALLDLLEQSNDARVVPIVTAALSGLQRLGPDIAPLLLERFDAGTERERPFLPLLLAATLGPSAEQRLLDALHDRQLDVRINAATQLGSLRAQGAFQPLLTLLLDPQEPLALRGVAAAALGALRDPRALPILIDLVDAEEPELLAGAIDGLADLRDPAGIPVLERVLERPGLDERTTRALRLGLLAMERYRSR